MLLAAAIKLKADRPSWLALNMLAPAVAIGDLGYPGPGTDHHFDPQLVRITQESLGIPGQDFFSRLIFTLFLTTPLPSCTGCGCDFL